MTDLIQNLTSQLGIDAAQAEGGLGAIAKLAQEKLGGEDFSQLTEKVPGLASMISKAPASEGGMGGMLGSAMSALGGESAGNLTELVSMFSKLGLDADMVAKFAPIVMEYVQNNGGDIASTLMKKLF